MTYLENNKLKALGQMKEYKTGEFRGGKRNQEWNRDSNILRVQYYFNLNAWYVLDSQKKVVSRKKVKVDKRWIFFSTSTYIVEQFPYQLIKYAMAELNLDSKPFLRVAMN